MSMLSAQIDELRTMAAMLVIKDMSEVAAVVRDAADTIWQLRDDLQRANADNAKLRAAREMAVEDAKSILVNLSNARAKNAKLRELCAGLLTGYECGHGELCKGCTWDGLGDPKTFPCLPRVKARELGVEVEG